MEKKFKKREKVCALIMTIVSFLAFWQSVQSVQNVQASAEKQAQEETEEENGEAAEEGEKRLKKVIPLNADTVTQIPKYIVKEDIAYMLDESSIVVEETGSGSSEGAEVVTVSRKEGNLPDNDLARIEKEVRQEGIVCELLSVVYEVEEQDEYGIPTRYSALCEYGGLKKYSVSYPAAWQMTVWYDVCKTAGEADTVIKYEYVRVPDSGKAEKKGTKTAERAGNAERRENAEEEEDAAFPKPSIQKFYEKQTPEGESKKKISDILLPLAAAGTAGAGVTLPLIIWFTVMTAPLYVLKKEEKYRYIGQIRLKKEDGIYTAYLTKRLLSKAEIPSFMIRLSERVRKKTKAGVLQVHCPDGKRILLTVGKEVNFTVEGEEI